VILYSTQLIKTIENNGGQIPSSDAVTNAQVKEDLSTMVLTVLDSIFTVIIFPVLNFFACNKKLFLIMFIFIIC